MSSSDFSTWLDDAPLLARSTGLLWLEGTPVVDLPAPPNRRRHFHSVIESRFHSLVKAPFRQRLKTDYWAYWKCEDTEMPVRDSVGLADFVTPYGFSGEIHSTTGKFGNGFDCGPFPDPILTAAMDVQTRSTSRFNFEDHDFTIRAWVNLGGPDAFGNNNGFSVLRTQSTNIWELWVKDDLTDTRKPVWTVIKPDLSKYEIIGPTLAFGTWYWLFAYYRHGFVIGLRVGAGYSATLAATSGIRHMAAQYVELNGGATSANTHNLIDEVAVWDHILTDSERRADFNSGAGVTF